MQRLQEEMRQQKRGYEEDIRILKTKIEELENALQFSQKEAEAQLRDMEGTMRLEVEKVRTEGVEMVQRLSTEHEAKLESIFQKQSAALEQLQQKLGSSHQERIDEMRAKHSRDIDGLKTAHAADMRDAAASHKAALQEVRTEKARAIQELENAAKAAADRHASEVHSLNESLQSERGHLKSARAEALGLQEELRKAQASAAEMEAQFNTAVAKHEETTKRRQQEFDREKRHLKEQHKRGVEQLLEKHIKETAALKEQFDRARHLQEMQMEMQQQRIIELQNLYNSRPSREEDLQLIAHLETDVQAKSAHIKKLLDDMQFYKLELVNREQNYNKVFGAAPTVGIMNPIAAKKPSGPSGAQQMRVVQQPGAAMNGVNMGLPPLGTPAPTRSNSNKPSKRPSSGSMRRAGSME